VDLSNAYLAIADLSQADLREANFTRSDLSGGKPGVRAKSAGSDYIAPGG
jgi:uncharacterized protein YjbI with pentapeptide repeats